ncbi:hypothetical protein HYR69_05590 [Candidatus Sumerlaeota bacterium]|nr:hypothetical protein [Candidatus Sumerlaeota bacterium]
MKPWFRLLLRIALAVVLNLVLFLGLNFVLILVFIHVGIGGEPPPGYAISEGISLMATMASFGVYTVLAVGYLAWRLARRSKALQ